MIYIKTAQEIEKIRKSGQLASQTLDFAEQHLKIGQTTAELDHLIHEFITSHGAIPATLGYRGFPASSCISINEVVVHGIPGPRVLSDGDLIKVDVTTILNGYYGDTARTFLIGQVPEEGQRLTQATKESLDLAIKEVKSGTRLGDIGATIQEHVEPRGFSVVRQYVGHGVGRYFHESPNVPHYGRRGTGYKIKSGMVFTIEPMINAGTWEVDLLDDDWTVVTADGRLSAQFEHTIVVTDRGHEILTLS